MKTKAIITDVSLLNTATAALILVNLQPVKAEADGTEKPHGLPVSFNINLQEPTAARIACDDLRLALPELFLGKTDREVQRALLRGVAENKTVLFEKIEQIDRNTGRAKLNPKTGQAYFNVRLRPQLKDVSDDALDALLDSISIKAEAAPVSGDGNWTHEG